MASFRYIYIYIYFDISQVESYNPDNEANLRQKNLLLNYFVPFAYNYFKNSFKVRESKSIITNNINPFCKNKIDSYNTEGKNKDFYLNVKIINTKDISFAGLATYCDSKKETNRPYVGYITINMYYLNQINQKNIENYKQIIIHEIMHAWGFTNKSFSLFINNNFDLVPVDNYVIRENDTILLKNSKLLNHAKQFFNCPTIKGVKFENFGPVQSKGEHFEITQIGYDIMNSRISYNSRISNFIFKFFESSGWYQLNYDYSQKLIWGNNKGCKFLDRKYYSEFSEFCFNKEVQNCSEDFLMTSQCINYAVSDSNYFNNYVDYCNIKLDNSGNNKWNYIHHDSRCLINKKSQNNFNSNCYKSYCTNNGKSVIFELNNTLKLECTKEGDLNFNNSVYSCPNIEKFCDLRYECKNSCSGNGTCFNGNCICFYKYLGIACEHKQSEIIDSSCKNNCNNNGTCISGKCQCYDNYQGNNCKTIINDVGSFGSFCFKSIYVKCYKKLSDNILYFKTVLIMKITVLIFIIII